MYSKTQNNFANIYLVKLKNNMNFEDLTQLALKFKLRNMMRERQENQALADCETHGWYSTELELNLSIAFKENADADLLIEEKYLWNI